MVFHVANAGCLLCSLYCTSSVQFNSGESHEALALRCPQVTPVLPDRSKQEPHEKDKTHGHTITFVFKYLFVLMKKNEISQIL